MAGGKETPRQKMIGMMYLVLTALLALNVSTTIIDKFLFINESLIQANEGTKKRNVQTIESIQSKANDTKDSTDLQILSLANQLRAKSSEVNTYLANLKESFIEETGGYLDGEKGNLAKMKGKTDVDKVGHYMFPEEEGGKGNGVELEETLDDYVVYVKDLLQRVGADQEQLSFFRELTEDAEDNKIYSQDENQKGKKFIQLAFESSPTPAALATVSEFQSKVLQYEAAALDYLRGRVGAGEVEVKTIVPMVLPVSQYVAAGAKYEAEMFIAASTSSAIEPVMTMNGNELAVAGGRGKVSFTATAPDGSYDKNGVAKKSFKASITVKSKGGEDKVFTDEIDYYVVKPVIQIQSDAVQALYLNCGNDLDVQVPALGNAYNPSFSASGGSAIKGSKIGKVKLVPKTVKPFTLSVSNGGNLVGKRTFQVRRIPAPSIEAYQGNRPVNLKTGIPAKTSRLDMKAVPDESFQKFLPKDANFRVQQGTVYLVRAGNSMKTVPFTGPRLNLASIAAVARKGDNLVIEIKKVVRANYKNEIENFNNIPASSRTISIPLR
ncbi:MAG: gliding motility protein GldM [Cyclobacteriaceae bacterium]